MGFMDGFRFALGGAAAALAVGGVWMLARAWLRRLRGPDLSEPPQFEDEAEFTEDPRPDWMKARSGRPYDPTAGYVPRRGRANRSTSTNPGE